MKLTEFLKPKELNLKPVANAHFKTEITLEPKDGYYDDFKCEVFYDFEAGGHSDHPYGSGSAREEHEATIDFIDAITASEVKLFSDDDSVSKTFPKGTSLSKMPGWSKSDEKYLKELCEKDYRDNL